MHVHDNCPKDVALATRNALAVTVGLALLPELAVEHTKRLLGPIRSIEVATHGTKVTIEVGMGERYSNVRLEIELAQVEVRSIRNRCYFTGRVTDELHHGASYEPFNGSFSHGETGISIVLNPSR
jgi:hypothetical protein